jgi:peptidoglycan DL-endopeptidase CwlO
MTSPDEVAALQRAHDLFASHPPGLSAGGGAELAGQAMGDGQRLSGPGFAGYRRTAARSRADLRNAADTDSEMMSILRGAANDHAAARQRTKAILDAAKTDQVPAADTPMGQREAVTRRIARLRAQHRTVESARLSGVRRRALIRALRYRSHGGGADLARLSGAPNPRAAQAVRAALSKLGKPYVWGATGPDRFDCSGLTQWAYKHAGVDPGRTTYSQIHSGISVPRSLIQPGDLVFPHTGHVQMYIGDGRIVEAPHSGANVRIAQLGSCIAIRRPAA